LRQRARLFYDAYPFVYLPDEKSIIRFQADDEAYTFLGRFNLLKEQAHAKLVKSNLSLHILSKGDPIQVQKWGCFKGDKVYVNNGRGGMFRISVDTIEEVDNGVDGVFMLAPEVAPWPELTEETLARMAAIGEKLGRYGMKVTDDSALCKHFNALFEAERMTAEQYQQVFFTRFLSMFMFGVSALNPILMTLGQQNSGKSTLFEKIFWLIVGMHYESDAMPTDLRSLLAAVTNNHAKIFDNIDGIDVEEEGFTDYLCKCSTGGEVPIAQLYSTNVEKKYRLRCDLFFTARVNPWPSQRSDLSRRTIVLPVRKPTREEYRAVEVIKRELAEDREEMYLELLVRLQRVLRGVLANRHKEYPPNTEMHSYETFTMRVADYEGWADEMESIWKAYFGDYQARVTEYSPIVDEIRKWLGYTDAQGQMPNVGRRVFTGELYKAIRAIQGRDCTWKNDASFGKAIQRHLSALTILGIDLGKSNGSTTVAFNPSEEQLAICKTVSKSCGAPAWVFTGKSFMDVQWV